MQTRKRFSKDFLKEDHIVDVDIENIEAEGSNRLSRLPASFNKFITLFAINWSLFQIYILYAFRNGKDVYSKLGESVTIVAIPAVMVAGKLINLFDAKEIPYSDEDEFIIEHA